MVLRAQAARWDFQVHPRISKTAVAVIALRVPEFQNEEYRVPRVASSVYSGDSGLLASGTRKRPYEILVRHNQTCELLGRRRLVRHKPVHLLEVELHLRNPLRAAGDGIKTGFV